MTVHQRMSYLLKYYRIKRYTIRNLRSVDTNYIPTAIVAIHGITGNVISGLYANTL
ncbi:MAG: hypothetical protein HQL61_17440, partial [Magnetococcales bacterium]|nr:hypothetical protein [Nitrospirota bacterium]